MPNWHRAERICLGQFHEKMSDLCSSHSILLRYFQVMYMYIYLIPAHSKNKCRASLSSIKEKHY